MHDGCDAGLSLGPSMSRTTRLRPVERPIRAFEPALRRLARDDFRDADRDRDAHRLALVVDAQYLPAH